MTFRKITLILALLTGLSSFHNSYATTQETIDQDIASLLANAPAEALGFGSREVGFTTEDQELYAIYHENGPGALWVTPDGPGNSANALYEAINNAAVEGLDRDDYHFSTLTRYWNSSDSLELSRLDILVTLTPIAWDRAKIDEVVDSKKRTIRSLKNRLAAHIIYQTAWTDIDG
ncbi:hypothetical protein N9H39_08850 [Gammaproteobacteria bacterium]|nr:hypothetical protein [Gammaproteobacteria bacterium]